MQHTDKARAEFEAAITEHQAANGFDPVTFFRADNGEYSDPTLNAGFWAWQESRRKLVIDLPQPFEGDDFIMYDGAEMKAAIEAAGLTVKE